ncbi:hypothetical protein L596_010941 [Steinernema carpocapsae]|uniref:Uncharacterized protein n=1 Tax=Steinernema carpocapsae TaxID=34508 RepID=A0A4U5PK97_STECR|nr:hypothetical protein L596_010941 [Steinernema carpocapsae]
MGCRMEACSEEAQSYQEERRQESMECFLNWGKNLIATKNLPRALLNVSSAPSAATVSLLIPNTFVGRPNDPNPTLVFERPALIPAKNRVKH